MISYNNLNTKAEFTAVRVTVKIAKRNRSHPKKKKIPQV